MPVLLVILTVSTVLSLAYIFGLRKTYASLLADRDGYVQQVIQAEQRAARSETECTYMKLTLNNVLQRPAVAMVSEDLIQQFAAIVQSITKPGMEN